MNSLYVDYYIDNFESSEPTQMVRFYITGPDHATRWSTRPWVREGLQGNGLAVLADQVRTATAAYGIYVDVGRPYEEWAKTWAEVKAESNAVAFVDMDGVVAGFYEGVCRLYGRSPWPCPPEYQKWSWFREPGWDKTWEDLAPHMDELFFASLDWTADGQEILRRIIAVFGNNVCFLTSPWRTVGSYEGKRAWIAREVPELKDHVLAGSAKQFCARPGAVLFDDSEEMVNKFTAAGGRGILIPCPQNSLAGDYDCVEGRIKPGVLDRIIPKTKLELV